MISNKDAVLAAFVPAAGAVYTPVQVQKMLFLIDRNLSSRIGTRFEFIPYSYGPFDKNIYSLLEQLEAEGCVEILCHPFIRWKKYKLTCKGQQEGEKILASLEPQVRDFITKVSVFVRSLSFAELVSAIYQAYPEMRANSVFQS